MKSKSSNIQEYPLKTPPILRKHSFDLNKAFLWNNLIYKTNRRNLRAVTYKSVHWRPLWFWEYIRLIEIWLKVRAYATLSIVWLNRNNNKKD